METSENVEINCENLTLVIPKCTCPLDISNRLWLSPVNNENSLDQISSWWYFRKLLLYQWYFLYFPIFYFTIACQIGKSLSGPVNHGNLLGRMSSTLSDFGRTVTFIYSVKIRMADGHHVYLSKENLQLDIYGKKIKFKNFIEMCEINYYQKYEIYLRPTHPSMQWISFF